MKVNRHKEQGERKTFFLAMFQSKEGSVLVGNALFSGHPAENVLSNFGFLNNKKINK